MAKSLTTDTATVFIPGAYPQFKVQSSPSGLATTGVLMLVGEADSGRAFSAESDLEDTSVFGPDQLGDVTLKYGSGPLVDAFRAAVQAANDPDITGSFAGAVLVKTNVSTKAVGNLPKGVGTYAVIADKSFGRNGNNIAFRTSTGRAEIAPSTGAFTYIPAVNSYDYRIRVNGLAAVGSTIAATPATGVVVLPPALVTTIDGLAGIDATGGASRGLVSAAGGRSVSVTATGNTVVVAVTAGPGWTVVPAVGDTFMIRNTAPAGLRDPAGGSTNENVGAYVVTAASATSLTAVKLSDAGRTTTDTPAVAAGTITAPVNTASPVALAAASDIETYAPVVISVDAGAVIDGVGKSLEIAELTTGADLISRTAFALSTAQVSWISRAVAPFVLGSAAEFQTRLDVNRTSDLASENFTAGGEIALRIGYAGGDLGTATLTNGTTTITTTVTGGSGANLTLQKADFASIQALVDFINTQTGYSASVGTAALGSLPLSVLDRVTAMGICGHHLAQAGRLKLDGFRFGEVINGNSSLVQIGNPAAASTLGLPDNMTAQVFLAGGTKGGTTNAAITSALTALETVRGNFVVPLFSRDAALDIADALTDAASTYTIAGVHAAVRSHVLAMSTFKRRRNRQAFLSIADNFLNSREIAANIASFRCAMSMQDFLQQDADGNVVRYLPWMGAVLAASMQAAGFYRNIQFKGINTSGVVHRAGDFNVKNETSVEDALRSGLLIARPAPTGGFQFVSDQTTYGKDNNFVFNSVQAVYAADTVSLTMAQRMEAAFVGQSVADISATVARSFAEGILAELLRLKLLAPSDDNAPKGWKNLTIKIIGNVMKISVEIKLATAIDFITIDFLVSPVQQAA
jgi:hypothetical protein